MPDFINQFHDRAYSYISGDTFVRTNNDQVIFGEKTFLNDVYISGDLTVSGATRTESILDLDVTGDISGYIFRGTTGYFDTIVTEGLQTPGGGKVAGGGGIDGGPIFVENATASVGSINIESTDDQGFIEEISTAENFFNAHIMLERGDSQSYRPTGVLYYQTGQALETPNEEFPVYVDPASLTLDSNGYSWNKTINLPINDSLIDSQKKVYYVFKNGDRSTEMRAKLETAPEVVAAEFIDQGNGSIYPTYGGSFTDESGTTHSNFIKEKVKNGDTVKVRIEADKDFIQIQLGGGLSGTINVGATTSHEFTRTISAGNTSDQDKSFTVKVKDDKGNWSDVKSSTDFSPGTAGGSSTITANNFTPSISISSVSYDNGVSAIQQGLGSDTFTYNINYSGPNSNIYWQIDWKSLVNNNYASLQDWMGAGSTLPSSAEPSSGSVQFIDGSSVISQGETSMSPFSIRLFNKENGNTSGWINAGSVFMQQYGFIPNINLSSKTIRIGDDNGNTESISVTCSGATLLNNNSIVEDGGSVEDSSGSDLFVAMDLNSVTIRNGASTGQLNISKTYTITKKSQEVISNISLNSGTITVKGFELKTLTFNGGSTLGNARHSDGILIQGDNDSFPSVVVNTSKIKSGLGSLGNVSIKIGTGGEGNYPYSSTITSTNIENASTTAEVGLNPAKDHILFDYHLLGMIPPDATVVLKIEEVV